MKQNTSCVEILIREYLKYSYVTVETKKLSIKFRHVLFLFYFYMKG